MATGYLTAVPDHAGAVSSWYGSENAYGAMRYTQPAADGSSVTLYVPAEMQGADFVSAHLSYQTTGGTGTRSVRFYAGESVTDARLLERLQNGETEIRLYFSFRAAGGSGGDGMHNAVCQWSQIAVTAEYVPRSGVSGMLGSGEDAVSYFCDVCCAAPGETLRVSLRAAPGTRTGQAVLELSDESGTVCAADEAAWGADGSAVFGLTPLSAVWSGRVAEGYLRLTEEGGTPGERTRAGIRLCAQYRAPQVSCVWSDADSAADALGVFVQGKSRLVCRSEAVLDTEADPQAHVTGRRLVLDGREIPMGTDETEAGIPDAAGDAAYTLYVTDSHGMTGTASGTLHIAAYAPPRLTALEFERYRTGADALGETVYEPDDGSDTVRVSAQGSVSAVNGRNAWTFGAVCMCGETRIQTTLLSGSDGREIAVDCDRELFPYLLAETGTWQVSVTLADRLETVTYELSVPKAGGLVNLERGGLAVGMRSTGTAARPLFEVAYPAVFYGGVSIAGGEWTQPELVNCTEYSADYPVRARKYLGMLQIRGAVKLNALLASGTTRQILRLPPALAPAYAHTLWAGQGYGLSVEILPDGSVTLRNRSGAGVTAGNLISVECSAADSE